MSTFQTLLALVVLIYVLCVIVQAVQEAFKSWTGAKAKTMEEIIKEFMGKKLLTSEQVRTALQNRGLGDLSALENLNKDSFRQLMDAIPFTPDDLPEIRRVVGKADASVEEFKQHAEGAYDAAMAKFQASYAKHNKLWVRVFGAVVVLVLNANLILLYQELAADQVTSQAIASTADKLIRSQPANTPTPPAANPPSAPVAGAKPAQTSAKAKKDPATPAPGSEQPTAAGTVQSPGASGNQPAPPAKATSADQQDACNTLDPSTGLAKTYEHSRDCIQQEVAKYPILVRWAKSDPSKKGSVSWFGPQLAKDVREDWFNALAGLLLMWALVSLGAPFWNDVLKGMTGVNNALNTGGGKKTT